MYAVYENAILCSVLACSHQGIVCCLIILCSLSNCRNIKYMHKYCSVIGKCYENRKGLVVLISFFFKGMIYVSTIESKIPVI